MVNDLEIKLRHIETNYNSIQDEYKRVQEDKYYIKNKYDSVMVEVSVLKEYE